MINKLGPYVSQVNMKRTFYANNLFGIKSSLYDYIQSQREYFNPQYTLPATPKYIQANFLGNNHSQFPLACMEEEHKQPALSPCSLKEQFHRGSTDQDTMARKEPQESLSS